MIVFITISILVLWLVAYAYARVPHVGDTWCNTKTRLEGKLIEVSGSYITIYTRGYNSSEVTWTRKEFLKEHYCVR